MQHLPLSDYLLDPVCLTGPLDLLMQRKINTVFNNIKSKASYHSSCLTKPVLTTLCMLGHTLRKKRCYHLLFLFFISVLFQEAVVVSFCKAETLKYLQVKKINRKKKSSNRVVCQHKYSYCMSSKHVP